MRSVSRAVWCNLQSTLPRPAIRTARRTHPRRSTIYGLQPVSYTHLDVYKRQVRYTESPVGLNPTQIDYADYREVAGVRMPYRVTVTWLDGKSITEFSEIQPNVAIEAERFAKPPRPALNK